MDENKFINELITTMDDNEVQILLDSIIEDYNEEERRDSKHE